MDNYLERELRRLLTANGGREKFFGDAVRLALVECETFRQHELSYEEALRHRGYQPDAERDMLALAFVENAAQWRHDLRGNEASVSAVSTNRDVSPEVEEAVAQPNLPSAAPAADSKLEPLLLAVDESQAEHVLLTTKQAAQYLNLSPRALEGYRGKGGGPIAVKLSERAVRYRFSDLLAWVKGSLRSSTSDPGGMR